MKTRKGGTIEKYLKGRNVFKDICETMMKVNAEASFLIRYWIIKKESLSPEIIQIIYRVASGNIVGRYKEGELANICKEVVSLKEELEIKIVGGGEAEKFFHTDVTCLSLVIKDLAKNFVKNTRTCIKRNTYSIVKDSLRIITRDWKLPFDEVISFLFVLLLFIHCILRISIQEPHLLLL